MRSEFPTAGSAFELEPRSVLKLLEKLVPDSGYGWSIGERSRDNARFDDDQEEED
jgi:hypothetical protein